MTAGVYQLRNGVTGGCFIGQSRNLEKWFYWQRLTLRGGRHTNKILQAAWDEFGEGAFEWMVLEEVELAPDEPKREAVARLRKAQRRWHDQLQPEYNVLAPARWEAPREVAGVYQLLNVVTNERYVGCSVDVATRLGQHRRHLEKRKHHNRRVQAAWDEFGEKAFVFGLLDVVDLSDCLDENGRRVKWKACQQLKQAERRWFEWVRPEYNFLGQIFKWMKL